MIITTEQGKIIILYLCSGMCRTTHARKNMSYCCEEATRLGE
jgi:hypothetical protein